MKQSSLLNKLYKVFLIIMILLWSIITFTSIFRIYTNDNYSLNSMVVLIGSFISIMFITFLYRLLGKLNERQHSKIAVISFFIVFLLMSLWGINNRILSTYDLSHAISKASEMLSNNHIFGSSAYFSIYPNQIPLTLFIFFIENIGSYIGFSDPEYFMIIYNAFMTSLTLLSVYYILKRMFNSKIALMGFFLLAIYPDFYLFIPYYYTDILSLPFGIIGFLLILKADSMKGIKANLLYLFAGLMFAIGFKLRVVIAILLIAYIVVTIIRNKPRKYIAKLALIVLSMIATLMVYNNFIYPMFDIKIDENLKLPATHWVMMGLNEETSGRYTDADVMYSLQSPNKNRDINKKIVKRIRKVNYNFFIDKLSLVWSSGNHDAIKKYTSMKEFGATYNFLNGKNRVFLLYFSQILKVTIYVLFLISLIYEFSIKDAFDKSKNMVIIVAIFGAILFYLMWEALLRYSFSFLPWIVIGGVSSLELISNAFAMKNLSIDNKKINLEYIRKTVAITVMTLLVIILGINFFKFSVFSTRDRKTQVYQNIITYTFLPVIDNEVKEVFRVKDDFNLIQLKIDNSTVLDSVEYIYELYDEDDNLIYRDTCKIIEGDKASKDNPHPSIIYSLKFPLIKVDGKKEYYLKFYSKDANKRNYVSLNYFTPMSEIPKDEVYSPEFLDINYDVNPSGETYLDGALSNKNIYIKISNQVNKPLVNIYVFIVFIIVILLISTISMKYVLLNRKRSNFLK